MRCRPQSSFGARCQNVLLRVESWTESSVLRLSRRRFNTLRPPGLLIRLRKPCVRNRLRTFGCQVRFGISSLSKLTIQNDYQ